MQESKEQSELRIIAKRGGSIREITSFLEDLEDAYNVLYNFTMMPSFIRHPKYFFRFYEDFGVNPFNSLNEQMTPPEDLLIVSRVSINSPGFWGVLGAINPLKQLREYLNERHERQKDRKWRNAGQKEKQVMENQILEQKFIKGDNEIIQQQLELLKQAGVHPDEIKKFVWNRIGEQMSGLGKHQDNGLIGGAD